MAVKSGVDEDGDGVSMFRDKRRDEREDGEYEVSEGRSRMAAITLIPIFRRSSPLPPFFLFYHVLPLSLNKSKRSRRRVELGIR